MALGLRAAFANRILAFPVVRTVWLAHARWIESGYEQLMIQVAVDESAHGTAQALLDVILAHDVTLRPGDPTLALRVLQPAEADTIQEIDRMGLDTIRADHAHSRVEIISREFESP